MHYKEDINSLYLTNLLATIRIKLAIKSNLVGKCHKILKKATLLNYK